MPLPDFRARWRALHTGERTPIRAEAPAVRGDTTTAVLRLYDVIDSYGGPWGVSAREFADVLDELPDTVDTIEVHINSPGGEAMEGVAILNLLRQHSARYVAVVDGIAASAASFIAAGADETVMAPNSELFVHRAWGMVVGNAEDMTSFAAELDHLDRNLASIYAAKTGGTVDEWLAAMTAETWFSADEAVAAGLADRVDGEPASSEAKNRFDLSIFKNSRRDPSGAQHPDAEPGDGPNPTARGGSAVAFSDEQMTELRQRLDVADDADEGAILAALDGLLEQVTAPPEPADVTLPEGVVAIDAAQLDELRADAQAGREARAEQLRNERERLVNEAVADGRIPPARRDHWVAQLEADPGAANVLAGLQKGLVPVNGPIGANGQADLDSDDALYAAIYGQEATR